MLVRLYHAYPGLDPLSAPLWLVDILTRGLDHLEASSTLNRAYATRLGWAKQEDYRRAARRLERMAAPVDKTAALVVPANDAAREWFIAQGIPVSGGHEEVH